MAPVRLLSTLALSGVLDALLPRLAAGLPPVEFSSHRPTCCWTASPRARGAT